MGAFSVASGLTLLYDEGVLPPNPSRQALAFATPEEASKLGSDGLALRTTATVLAMDDQTADGTAELSPAAMQFLVQDLASPAREATPQQSGYPYGGWASGPAATPAESPATLPPDATSAPINLLA